MEATFKMPCDLRQTDPNKRWLSELLRQNPDLTGWPFFVDLWNAARPEFAPRRTENGVWESRLFADDGMDYWRIDGSNGLFFVARALEDDTSRHSPAPGEVLDFGLVILRVAELIIVAQAFANFLCGNKCGEGASVSMRFKWTGIKGRKISNWAHRERFISQNPINTDVEAEVYNINVPLISSNDEAVILTERVVNKLFGCFGGWEVPSIAVSQLVDKLVSRRL